MVKNRYVCVCAHVRIFICVVLIGEAHMEAVHADWKEYLNLLICEENHLKHMEDYHKVRQKLVRHLKKTHHTCSLVKLISL